MGIFDMAAVALAMYAAGLGTAFWLLRDTREMPPQAPEKWEPRNTYNPGLEASRKYHMEGSESEIAERIARGNW